MRALAGAFTLGAALGSAPGVRAAELLLAQPSPCAVGEELSFRAERALGRPLAAAADVRCTIRMARAPGAFTARLELARGDGPPQLRSFSAPSCEALTDTLALAVVLALGGGTETGSASSSTADSGAALPTGPIAVEAASVRGAPVPEEARASDARDATPIGGGESSAPAAAPTWTIRGALAADAGSLPGVGLGAQLGASVAWSELELRVLGSYFPSQHASAESLAGAPIGAELGLAAGSLLLCVPELVRAASMAFGACGGAELGALSGQGSGLSEPHDSQSLWAAAIGQLSARWGMGQGGVALEALLGAAVPLVRDEFGVVDEGNLRVLHRPAPVAVRASVGVGISLD